MEKKLPDFGELTRVKLKHVFDPPPDFYRVLDKEKLIEVVQLQLELETIVLKQQVEIITKKVEMYEKLKKMI